MTWRTISARPYAVVCVLLLCVTTTTTTTTTTAATTTTSTTTATTTTTWAGARVIDPLVARLRATRSTARQTASCGGDGRQQGPHDEWKHASARRSLPWASVRGGAIDRGGGRRQHDHLTHRHAAAPRFPRGTRARGGAATRGAGGGRQQGSQEWHHAAGHRSWRRPRDGGAKAPSGWSHRATRRQIETAGFLCFPIGMSSYVLYI